MKENRRTVLRAYIRSLTIQSCWIVNTPKEVQQFVIANLRWIECHLHHLGMAGFIGTNILISWILLVTAKVSHSGIGYARQLAKGRLDTPKTSCSKSCEFHKRLLSLSIRGTE